MVTKPGEIATTLSEKEYRGPLQPLRHVSPKRLNRALLGREQQFGRTSLARHNYE
jgi:hypothetical protein